MQRDSPAQSEPVACPICGRPLRRTADRWLSVFECDRCGQFSDFGDASLSPAQSRRSSQLHRQSKPIPSES